MTKGLGNLINSILNHRRRALNREAESSIQCCDGVPDPLEEHRVIVHSLCSDTIIVIAHSHEVSTRITSHGCDVSQDFLDTAFHTKPVGSDFDKVVY